MFSKLSAVCFSSFLPIYQNVSPVFQPAAENKKYHIAGKENHFNKNAVFASSSLVDQKPIPAALRVVAVKLLNNTDKEINLRERLKIVLSPNPEKAVVSIPTVFFKKQAASIYFLYNLLHQKLPDSIPGTTKNFTSGAGSSTSPSTSTAAENVFMTNTQYLDLMAELKKASLIHKIIAPGETISGLLLLQTASAALLEFYIKS